MRVLSTPQHRYTNFLMAAPSAAMRKLVQQPRVKSADMGIATSADDSSHVERGMHPRETGLNLV